MKKTKVLALALAVVVPATVGAAAFRVFAHGGHGHHKPELMEKLIRWHVDEELDALQASDDQKRQVRQIEDRILKELSTLHRDGSAIHAQLLATFEQDAPDRERVREIIDSHMADAKRFANVAADAALELHAILTPEQRRQLLAHAREHMSREHMSREHAEHEE